MSRQVLSKRGRTRGFAVVVSMNTRRVRTPKAGGEPLRRWYKVLIINKDSKNFYRGRNY